MKFRSCLTLAVAFAFSPLAVSANDLPDARMLMDAHIKAIGGTKALENYTDGTTKASVEIVEAGMKGDMLMHQRGDDLTMVLTFPNYGETRMGMTGGVSWSIDPQSGPRILQGKESQQLAQQNDNKYISRDKSLLASAATTALSDSEGRACYRVEIEWKNGDKTADCYGVEDGLLLSTESTVSSPMGEIKQVTHIYDYKSIGPIKVAHTAKNKLAGMTQLYTMLSFDSAKLGDETFALPPAIDALVKKQNAKSESSN